MQTDHPATILGLIFTLERCSAKMKTVKQFTLEYWKDDGWFVGRLKEMPAVMSQGETLEELQSMIRDAYKLMVEDASESAFVPKEKQELSISL
jgi:predicted RNase H-like HicB family nuclease